MKTYTLRDVVKVADVTEPTAKGWIRAAALVSDLPGGGRGNHHRFSFMNLVEARVIARLHHNYKIQPPLLKLCVYMLRASRLKLAAEPETKDLAEAWRRLYSPDLRQPFDLVLLLLSSHFHGKATVRVFHSEPAVIAVQDYADLVVVNVRRAIEEVEQITGDTFAEAEGLPTP